MACQGARVALRLEEREVEISEMIPLDVEKQKRWMEKDEELEEFVCDHCAFKAEDCDFQSDSPPPDCEPCGGYILLAMLMENGQVDSEMLRRQAYD